ncbi:MAG: IS66 family insertion sequence element accessory protein TnpB [Christensenellales bacterium]
MLNSIIQKGFQLDPFANALFLFCGRRTDRFKRLCIYFGILYYLVSTE